MRKRSTVCLIVAAIATGAFASAASAAMVQDNQVAVSGDGTPIVYTLFTPDGASASSPVPAVLMTHGWGGTRQATATGFVQKLLDNGYAVLTWDQRGFGQSGGQAEVDSELYEGRDVSALIDVLAANRAIARNRANDPKVGMAGGSYAGGVQWVTAANDKRVDAIAPEISWHNLEESLFPQDVIKLGWDTLLTAVGQTSVTNGLSPLNPAGSQLGNLDPKIYEATAESAALGYPTDDVREFFTSRGPDYLLDRVKTPAFIIQGTVDTLFPPSQAVENYRDLLRLHPTQPLKMAWYCSGHGVCSFNPGDAGHIQNEIVAWFDRYVKQQSRVNTGTKFEYITQEGTWHSATAYPPPAAKSTRTGSGSGVVAVNGEPTAGGVVGPGATVGNTSLTIPIDSRPGTLIGAPKVTVTWTGVASASDNLLKAPLFFQLVNKTTNQVLGNQITPQVFLTDGLLRTKTFTIEPVAYTVSPGDQIALQVVSSSANYELYRGAGVFQLSNVTVEVPSTS
jgi:ABC-2 type transport system ATP-binding protein